MKSNHHHPESPSGAGCEAFAPLLPLVAQRLLGPDEAEAVREHLAGCEACRARLAAYDRLDNALRRHFEQIASPPIRVEGLMSRIRNEDYTELEQEPEREPLVSAPSLPPRSGRRGPRRVFSWVAAIAAVLVIALITGALFASHHLPGQTAGPRATPVVAPSQVYFSTISSPPSTAQDTVYALSAQDGSLHWQKELPALETAPVLSNGMLYLLTRDHQNNAAVADTVYAVNASDGTIRWHTSIGASALALQVVDGVVYTGTYTGAVFALNAGDGSVLWQRQISSSEVHLRLISNGAVYVSITEDGPHTQSGSLYALNAIDGTIRWHEQLHGYPMYISVVGDQIDVAAFYIENGPDGAGVFTSTFYALDAHTGAQRWSYTGPAQTIMNLVSADAGSIYLTVVATDSSLTTVLALDAGAGTVRWQKSIAGGSLNASVMPNNTMYLSFDGEFSAVSPLDGSEIWHAAFPEQVFLNMLVDGTLYVMSSSMLFALDSSDGSVKWRYQAPDTNVYAAANGVLYGMSLQGQDKKSRLFALDAASGQQLWEYDIASSITLPVLR